MNGRSFSFGNSLPNPDRPELKIEDSFENIQSLSATMCLHRSGVVKITRNRSLKFFPILFQFAGIRFRVSGVRIQFLGASRLTPET
jgi:hypothetical protein